MNSSCMSLASVYSKSDNTLLDHHNVEQIHGNSQILNFIRPQNYRRSDSNGYIDVKKKDKNSKIVFSNLGSALLYSLGLKRRECTKNKPKKSVKQVKRAQSTIPPSTKNQLQKTQLYVDLINLNSDSLESSPQSTTSSSSIPDSSLTTSSTRLNKLIGSIMNLSTMQNIKSDNNANMSSAWNLTYDSGSNSYYNGQTKSQLKKEELENNLNQEKIVTFKNIHTEIYNNFYKSHNTCLHLKGQDSCGNGNNNLTTLSVDLNHYIINRDEYNERKSKINDTTIKDNSTIAKKKQLKIKLRQRYHLQQNSDEVLKNKQKSNNVYTDYNNILENNGVVKYNDCNIYENKSDVGDKGYNVGTIYANVPSQITSLSMHKTSQDQTIFPKENKKEINMSPNGRIQEVYENVPLVEDKLSSPVCYSNNDLNVLIPSKKHLNKLRLSEPLNKNSTHAKISLRQFSCSGDLENCNRNKEIIKNTRPVSVSSFQKRKNDVVKDSCFIDSHHDFSPPISFSNNKNVFKDSLKHHFNNDNVKLCSITKRLETTNITTINPNDTTNKQQNYLEENFYVNNKMPSKRYIIKKYNLNKYVSSEELPENSKVSNPLPSSHKPFSPLPNHDSSFKNQVFFL